MASATDIITYIGIPLAVLGVLPILYTFGLSILTQRRIRHRLLHHGHKPHATKNNEEGFVLRASPMTSLIEVEMPRYTIAPMNRCDERYWEISEEAAKSNGVGEGHRLIGRDMDLHIHGHGTRHSRSQSRANEEGHGVERVESTLSMVEEGRVRGFLKGGSWRTFYWRRLVVGRKLYRIQYEDELREPPAEIEFADLVNFLMDWGAELDGMGWEKLRSGGLWTPAGTVLLTWRHHGEDDFDTKSVRSGGDGGRGNWVLRTSVADDGDGVLTLCVQWPTGQASDGARNATSLAPGWGRLRQPDLSRDEKQPNDTECLSQKIAALTDTNKHTLDSTSLRFKLESGLVCKVYPERAGVETGFTLDLFRMSRHNMGPEWFTSAVSAVLNLSRSSGSLWGFESSAETTTFIRKDTVPCGVLVLLDLLDSSEAPHWNSNDGKEDGRNFAALHFKRFEARRQAERLEASMPPAQAQVHRTHREQEERRAQNEQMMQQLAAARAREQKRMQDALVSPRMSCKAVAIACLGWLIKHQHVDKEATVLSVAEAVLYLLILQSQLRGDEGGEEEAGAAAAAAASHSDGETMPVLQVLAEWSNWAFAGGLKQEQFEMLERRKTEFCYAACLVAVVQEAATVSTGQGKASVDMLECLRLWRKVRLG